MASSSRQEATQLIKNDDGLKKLETWLRENGASILPSTNEYEALRFSVGSTVGVVYASRGGYSVSSMDVLEGLRCWRTNKPWHMKQKPTKRVAGSKLKGKIINRDGYICFFCHGPLTPITFTVEHLIEIAQGGSNKLGNLVGACGDCNQDVKNMTVVEKVAYRDKKLGHISTPVQSIAK